MQRLQEDHDNAAWMAEQLRAIGADVTRHDTNMLFVRVGEEQAPALGKFMQAQGVLINASPVVRLVTHTDVNRQQLSEVVAHWQAFYNAKESGVSQSVLVLGASGYIGQHLVRALSARAIRCWRRHAISTDCKTRFARRYLPVSRSQSAAGPACATHRYRYPLLSGPRHGRRR